MAKDGTPPGGFVRITGRTGGTHAARPFLHEGTGRGGFVGRLVRQSLLAHVLNADLVPAPAMPSIAPL